MTAFFENPRNLQEITPPFLNFRILTVGPIVMREGALIDYSIKLYGVPMWWKTRIEEYVAGKRFVDVQLEGPYARWHHLHTFADAQGGGTEIVDVVDYELPLGPLGTAVHSAFVGRKLCTIFDYRARVISQKFGDCARNPAVVEDRSVPSESLGSKPAH